MKSFNTPPFNFYKLQAILTYYVSSFVQKSSFSLIVRNEMDFEKHRCINTKITTCVAYNKWNEKSKMVVMEIKIPLDFHLKKQSLSQYLEKYNQTNSN